MKCKHWQNVVQHQIDGGIVGVPVIDDIGIRIDLKKWDLYFPDEDGVGIDLPYYFKVEEKEYLHVCTERVEIDKTEDD